MGSGEGCHEVTPRHPSFRKPPVAHVLHAAPQGLDCHSHMRRVLFPGAQGSAPRLMAKAKGSVFRGIPFGKAIIKKGHPRPEPSSCVAMEEATDAPGKELVGALLLCYLARPGAPCAGKVDMEQAHHRSSHGESICFFR